MADCIINGRCTCAMATLWHQELPNYEKVVLCGQHLQLEIRQARSRESAVGNHATSSLAWYLGISFNLAITLYTIEPFLHRLFAS
jgi:hypothetical protein